MPATQAIGRVGFVVGRKVLRRAVDRNRFRRLMREMLRSARASAIAFDIVLRLKRPVTASEMPQVVAEGLRLLNDADAARRAAS